MLRLLSHADFRVTRLQSGCATCQRPFRRGLAPASCGRCGLEMHGKCYWNRVASPAEREARGVLPYSLVLCAACRS